jgi:hypothetical protein
MNSEPYARGQLRWPPHPDTIIFGICLLNFIVALVNVVRIDREIGASGYIVGHWYPGAVMMEPFLLLVSAISLLINRWWSLLLALLLSGRVVYSLGYLSWTAVHYAHDVPMLSWQAMEKLWYVIYQPRPQYLFEVALATVLLIYAVALLVGMAFSRRAIPLAAG